MQIISRRANEGIVIDGQTMVKVIEVRDHEATVEISGPSRPTERFTLSCSLVAAEATSDADLDAVLC